MFNVMCQLLCQYLCLTNEGGFQHRGQMTSSAWQEVLMLFDTPGASHGSRRGYWTRRPSWLTQSDHPHAPIVHGEQGMSLALHENHR